MVAQRRANDRTGEPSVIPHRKETSLIYPLTVVVFRDADDRMESVARRALARTPSARFLCLLTDGDDSMPIKRRWQTRVEPEFPVLDLLIFRCQDSERTELIIAYLTDLRQKHPRRQIDLILMFEHRRGLLANRARRDVKKRIERAVEDCYVRWA